MSGSRLSSLARKKNCGRRVKRPDIDGVKMRAVLQAYQFGQITADQVRAGLVQAGVAGGAAEAMVRAFRPAILVQIPTGDTTP